ncbi:unnamed protein product [Caenorhabditis auriculariae]|uniref:TRIP4/RQT4 C2HC5-type zinc finger domain-containing protein n=1 Tax=Caenorhabditis auriculariae TaxID=2777116 RepID=A0A8S1HQ69_9PELO|nr:unnamed protein product [Caenorhabditis auriculariae]
MGKKQRQAASQGGGGVAAQRNVMAAKALASIADTVREGRFECLCQARIHALVLNCMGCGRIVCAQEGSGPCFTCGTLVCTREEREVLDRGSRKSAELLAKLNAAGRCVGGTSDLRSISQALEDATRFRNKLLEADADTERRTRVNDLQSDYSREAASGFLTAQERANLMMRQEQLKEMRKKQRAMFVVDIDIENETVRQKDMKVAVDMEMNDPVIRSILEKGDERRRAEEVAHNASINAQWSPVGFVPKYDEEKGTDFSSCLDEADDVERLIAVSLALSVQETENSGVSFAVSQPAASFVAHGLIKFLRWPEDVFFKGPIFISSTVDPINEKEIASFAAKYVRQKADVRTMDFSAGAVLGRVFLDDCLTITEFSEQFGQNSTVPGKGDFVLCFSTCDPYVVSVPHIPPAYMYEMDKTLKTALIKS